MKTFEWDGTSERVKKFMKSIPIPIQVKIIVEDEYICNEHGLWKGKKIQAMPNLTSTNKLKGYIIKSPKRGTNVYMAIHEVEILNPGHLK